MNTVYPFSDYKLELSVDLHGLPVNYCTIIKHSAKEMLDKIKIVKSVNVVTRHKTILHRLIQQRLLMYSLKDNFCPFIFVN